MAEPGLDLEMSGHGSELTYRDVNTILALVDSWKLGRIHFKDGGLEVDACVIEPQGVSPSVRTLDVASPSVGLFRTVRSADIAGEHAGEGMIIGHIVAPGRSTPVTAGVIGRQSVELLVEDGEFVEYGQPVAVIAQ
jgi:hypothetical protein